MLRRRFRTVSEAEQREWLRRNVRARRAELGLTALEASTRGGMSLRHWQKIEAGVANVTLLMLVKLATALETEAAALLRRR